jgi:hypothetical protein
VGTQPHRNVARIQSDLNVSSWTASPDGAVYSLALSGTTLYMGGVFQNVNATKKPWLAAVSTTTGVLTAWAPDLDGPVYAMGISGTTIYIGGQFFTINTVMRAYLAALDLTVGTLTAWDPEPDNFVWAIAFGPSTVYAGGDFSSVASGATTRNGVAAWTTTGTLTSWNPNVNGTVLSLAVSGATVYLGGSFNQIGANTTRNNLAAISASTGNPSSWNPNLNDAVLAIAVNGTSVLAGGDFTTAGGQPRSRLAAIDASTGSIQAWAPEPDAEVDCLALGGSYVYAGGLFNSGGGIARSNLAALDLTTGLPTGWNPGANQAVDALVVGTDKASYFVYAGGRFTTVGGVARPYLAKIAQGPGTVLTLFDAHADSAVTALHFSNETLTLYAGGRFLHLGGAVRSFVAAVTNGGVARPWAPAVNGIVYAFAPTPASGVFLGGAFTTPSPHVVKLDEDGTALAWSGSADGTVYALAQQDNVLYLGGDFHAVGDSVRLRIAAVDTVGGIALGWKPNADSTVRVMDARAGLFIGGSFNSTGGFTRKGAASYDSPEQTGKLAPWNPVVTGSVSAIVPYGNQTVIAGNFSSVKGITRSYLALVGSGARPASVTADRPASIELGPVWPNPVRTEGRMRFTLVRASRVSLALYDIAGRRARQVLDDKLFPAGAHDAAIPTAGLEPGVYFAHLRAGAAMGTRKLVIVH